MNEASHYSFLLKKICCMCAFVFLFGCTPHVSIQKPLDVSKANQSVNTKFTVRKQGTYRFALLFVRAKTLAEMENQILTWGDANNDGVPITLRLRVLRGETLILNETIKTTGTKWGYAFFHENQRLNTAVRLIRILNLSPGNYTAELSTLSEVESFKNTESYMALSYYNPKH